MERYNIPHPEIYEIIVSEYPDNTAKQAGESISKDVKDLPSIPITFATGDTMIPVARAVTNFEVDFSKVQAFHLDEYWRYPPDGKYSFIKFLYQNFFIPLGIDQRNIHTLNGLAKDPQKEVDRYEKLVTKHKIGLVILGIGPGGHIGFNESGTPFDSRTHLAQLSSETITRDQILRGQDTPNQALTQGIRTILEADRIILIAYGEEKGRILKKALHGDITPECPASALRLVGNKVTVLVDEKAGNLVK